MKILVCLGQVPDTTSKISFVDNNSKFNSTGVQFIIGPYDEYALSKAIDLRETQGGSVTVFTVGLSDTEATIRKALAIGADDAVRVDAEPTDAFFVATQIAHYAKDKGFDMILTGRESIDYNGGLVHGMLGELLGWPSISPAMKLEVQGTVATISREIEGGSEVLEVPLPFVAGCQEPIAEWKIPNMRGIMTAKSKPLEVIAPASALASVTHSGYELPAGRTSCKIIDANNIDELVNLLKNEAKVI
jgi:electron transfer flavoprotein beta subunit